jgi:hypothetical protein
MQSANLVDAMQGKAKEKSADIRQSARSTLQI